MKEQLNQNNKNKYQTRFRMHKVKKHWVFLSTTMVLLAGYVLLDNVSAHADDNANHSIVTTSAQANLNTDDQSVANVSLGVNSSNIASTTDQIANSTAVSTSVSNVSMTTHLESSSNSNVDGSVASGSNITSNPVNVVNSVSNHSDVNNTSASSSESSQSVNGAVSQLQVRNVAANSNVSSIVEQQLMTTSSTANSTVNGSQTSASLSVDAISSSSNSSTSDVWGTAKVSIDNSGNALVFDGAFNGNELGDVDKRNQIINLKFDNVQYNSSDAEYLFQTTNFKNLQQVDLSGITGWNHVTKMTDMFSNNTLQSINFGSNFDTSNVKDMDGMFMNTANLKTVDLSNFNTSNVTTMASMFSGASQMSTLNLNNFNTSQVTNMNAMFNAMSNLQTLNVNQFDVDQVTDFNYMFYNDTALSTLDLSNWQTNSATSMAYMFDNTGLTRLDLDHFTSPKLSDTSFMFNGNDKLTTINFSKDFTIGSVQNMQFMFANMPNIKNLDLSSFNTHNAINMGSVFRGDSSLGSLKLGPDFTAEHATNLDGFLWNTSLDFLDFTDFKINSNANMANFFDPFGYGLVYPIRMGDKTIFNPTMQQVYDLYLLDSDSHTTLNDGNPHPGIFTLFNTKTPTDTLFTLVDKLRSGFGQVLPADQKAKQIIGSNDTALSVAASNATTTPVRSQILDTNSAANMYVDSNQRAYDDLNTKYSLAKVNLPSIISLYSNAKSALDQNDYSAAINFFSDAAHSMNNFNAETLFTDFDHDLDTIASNSVSIDALSSTAIDLNHQLDSANQSAWNQERASASASIDDRDRKIDSLNQVVHGLNSQISSLNSNAAQITSQNNSLRSENIAVNTIIDNQHHQIGDLNQDVNYLSSQNNSLVAQNNQNHATINDQSQTINSLNQNVANVSSQNNSLVIRNQHDQDVLSNSDQTIQSLNDDVNKLMSQNNSLAANSNHNSNHDDDAIIDAQNHTIDSLNHKVHDLASQSNSLAVQNQHNDQLINDQMKSITSLNNEINKLASDNHSLATQNHDDQTALNDHDHQIDGLNSQVNSLAAQINHDQDVIQSQNDQIDRLKHTLSNANSNGSSSNVPAASASNHSASNHSMASNINHNANSNDQPVISSANVTLQPHSSNGDHVNSQAVVTNGLNNGFNVIVNSAIQQSSTASHAAIQFKIGYWKLNHDLSVTTVMGQSFNLTLKSRPRLKLLKVNEVNQHLSFTMQIGQRIITLTDEQLTELGPLYTPVKTPVHRVYVKATIYQHTNATFNRYNRQKKLKAGQILHVKSIVQTGLLTRYQLTNGTFITTNRYYVDAI